MNSTEVRQQAERSFKHEDAPNGRKAMPSYEVDAVAIREKTALLKALRLTAQRASTATLSGTARRP